MKASIKDRYICNMLKGFGEVEIVEETNGFRLDFVKKTGSVFLVSYCMLRKAMVAYTKPQQRKKEESKRLRGEADQIKFMDLRFERWQVIRFRKARRKQDVP